MAAPSPVIASLNWMPSRIALLLRESSFLRCPASAPVRQIQGFEEERISGSSQTSRCGDEPEIRNRQIVIREGRTRHSPSDAQAIFGRGENPHRSRWPSRRAQHCGAVPTRRDCREPVLHLVEGVPGGWQAAPRRRYCAGGDERRGHGSASASPGAEGGRGRAGAGIAPAQKKHDRGWGRRGMRYPASEKLEIIRLIEQSHLPVRRTLEKLGGSRPTFYRWYGLYQTAGPEALEDKTPRPGRVWNRIPDKVRGQLVQLALDEPELSPREPVTRFTDTKSYFVSEASVYRLLKDHDLIASPAYIVMKAADEFKDKTTAPNQLWQTDFTYLKVIGWGWFYLSTILDDFSRYIIAWKLCTTMRADDVTDTLQMALTASGCCSARVVHKPRLLSDNGSSYVSGDLAKGLEDASMNHVRGAPCHPQTQGKIERWHQTLKNRILLENYYLPGDLEAHIDKFVAHYNHRRYHESLSNLTPADVYFGRGQTILLDRERIKRNTIQKRRLQHQKKAA